MSDPVLVAENVHKTYKLGPEEILVLKGLDLTLHAGETLAVVGASGVGKSTLLHVLGLLDSPDQGRVLNDGEDLYRLSPSLRAVRRNRLFGFVFQFYHLIPELTALENTILPSMMHRSAFRWRREKKIHQERARGILDELGLSKRLRHRPSQLSGGERQRVAIGRAMMNEPTILLCDEPTGNLDPETSQNVANALWELKDRRRQTMLLVTHDVKLAGRADRVVRMDGGRLMEPAESQESL